MPTETQGSDQGFTTRIAEADPDSGVLRYRGVDVADLIANNVTYSEVWGLLVDGEWGNPLPAAEPFPLPIHTGDVRVDMQAGLAMLGPLWGFEPLLDIDDATARENLARASVTALSFVAQSARGLERPAVPQRIIDQSPTVTHRFMTRWHGEPDPEHVKAIDAYWVTAAEHGLSTSTVTARVIASTGADVAAALSGAVGALSGPLHGGAPARILPMLDAVADGGDARAYITARMDRHEKVMGFGHRIYRGYDPRAAVLKDVARDLGCPRYDAAVELEATALEVFTDRLPDRPITSNLEFWATVILDYAKVPVRMMPAMFACARTAAWCAHVLEQKRYGRLVRPTASYVGPGPRRPDEVPGWQTIRV
ncbi:citrate synthase 2 [Tsukamurella sp. 8F]|uniref:citrate synthase 2 n=1 Tax=unclassified Tsukamurella TaxID=2633480 RepID=UPI0023BA2319|nr:MULTISPECIES: citrate synthase 2 [unclassified Tsukamurella]MDF0529817.1 citrate synthase 2 [Tsukamurella sp. 8J]MDF0587009.1 citrate synthase 2 [Tsukamurella sp. 8F]